MKHVAIGFVWAATALVGSAWAGAADFKLVNRTGYEIEEIYISPTKREQWGNDRLGKYILKNNFSRTFRFGDTKHCRQDIRVVFTDGETVDWGNLNLCELNQITLRYNRKNGEVSAETQ